jgi:phosphopantetheine adenylyltransferase
LRRTLKSYDENFALIFPDHWCVRAVLSREFCHVSADHLKDLLRDDSSNTALIIRVLQRTIEFEHELNVRFKSASLNEHIEGTLVIMLHFSSNSAQESLDSK